MNDKSLISLTQIAQDYMMNALSENTKRAYKSDWQNIETFARQQNITSLPFTPQFVCDYISHLSKSGYKTATIRRIMTTISQAHKLANHADPVSSPLVSKTFAGLRKEIGSKQDRKRPLTSELIKQWIGTLDQENIKDIRDKAIILLGFAGALRRSEIANIQHDHLRFEAEGLVIFIPQSKTDQAKEGALVAIPYGSNGYCPVRALKRWIEVSGITEGYVFRGFANRYLTPNDKKMTGRTVALVVKRLCKDIGLNPNEYSGHSLRAGLATEAKRKGVTDQYIMTHGRWKSRSSFDRYVREGNLFRQNPVNALDL